MVVRDGKITCGSFNMNNARSFTSTQSSTNEQRWWMFDKPSQSGSFQRCSQHSRILFSITEASAADKEFSSWCFNLLHSKSFNLKFTSRKIFFSNEHQMKFYAEEILRFLQTWINVWTIKVERELKVDTEKASTRKTFVHYHLLLFVHIPPAADNESNIPNP